MHTAEEIGIDLFPEHEEMSQMSDESASVEEAKYRIVDLNRELRCWDSTIDFLERCGAQIASTEPIDQRLLSME